MSQVLLAVHGGAGRLSRRRLRQTRRDFESGLTEALLTGQRILLRGGSALNAVTEAVVTLEDNELFNAGRGSVLCADGTVELGASVMRGRDRRVGAVVGTKRTRNPVRAAQAMIAHGHGLLFGPEADRYAQAQGLEMVPTHYFFTKARRQQWERMNHGPAFALDHSRGTVGAVARDRRGNLAAATSTGGLVNQLAGRIGDTPIVGAGTWADNESCAVSATGDGDAFARICFARRVADLVELKGVPALAAASMALAEVKKVGGEGGCILIDAHGDISLPFTTPHMLRGWLRGNANPSLAFLPVA